MLMLQHTHTHTGSNPDQLSSLISKLLPHASALIFNRTLPQVDHTPSHTHFQGGGRRITGVISRLGEEVELTQVGGGAGLQFGNFFHCVKV